MDAAAPLQPGPGDIAVVVGSTGGIGAAIHETLTRSGLFTRVIGLSRSSKPPLDLIDETTIAHCARHVSDCGRLRLMIDATGHLHDATYQPEKSLTEIDAAHLQRSFSINAIGPALLMKHFLPLFARDERCIFVTLSARVGSIGDNALGGWYGYRAAKAALNQLVKTAAIETRRRSPHCVVAAMHPGTVDTALSQPFAKTGLDVQSPRQAAADIVATTLQLQPAQNGLFMDRYGTALPW